MRRASVYHLVMFCAISLAVSCRSSTQQQATSIAPTRTAAPISTKPGPTDTPLPLQPTEPASTVAPLTPTASPFPEEYLHNVTDDTGAIMASIPVVWSDLRTTPWVNAAGETIGTTFIASTDIDAYLKWQVEGVSISVSRRLDRGYIQLLDEEYAKYTGVCTDPFLDRWDFANEFHRGNYHALVDCGGVDDGWLRLFAVVSRSDPTAYTARVLAYDMIPLFGGDFGDMLMMFQVNPEKLP